MKYVLDASVALSWVMPRPLTAKALALRDDFRHHVHESDDLGHAPGAGLLLLASSTFPDTAAMRIQPGRLRPRS